MPQTSNKSNGLYYCDPPYKDANKYPNPTSSKGLQNPNMRGIRYGIFWSLLQTAGNKESIDYRYFDDALAAASGAGKFCYFQTPAGLFTPDWFFELDGAIKYVTLDGRMQVPWCPVFQKYWNNLHRTLAPRYKTNPALKFVVMSGQGQQIESFFASKPEEVETATQLALDSGYPTLRAAWVTGSKKVLDNYMAAWEPLPIQLVTGQPWQGQDGTDAQQELFDYGRTTYGNRFGASNHGLTDKEPKAGQPGATIIGQCSGCEATGYESHNAMETSARLDAQLNNARNWGANVIAVWKSDADTQANASVLKKHNDALMA